MESAHIPLEGNLRDLVGRHFVLLRPLSERNRHFSLDSHTGGYQDVMQTIADLVKVSMLALEACQTTSLPAAPEPASNISGVLALVLDMLPYEEAQFLDMLHKSYLEAPKDETLTSGNEKE